MSEVGLKGITRVGVILLASLMEIQIWQPPALLARRVKWSTITTNYLF